MNGSRTKQLAFTGTMLALSTSKEEELKKSSRLAAKVDSSCVQDGYGLYHHVFIFDSTGNWSVVQQGMRVTEEVAQTDKRYLIRSQLPKLDPVGTRPAKSNLRMNGSTARRYHWMETSNFVEGPPENICGVVGDALNLVSGESSEMRAVSVDLVRDDPIHLRKYFTGQTTLFEERYSMPSHHPVLASDLTEKDWAVLKEAYEYQPKDYTELVMLKGMGGKKLRALALVSSLVYGKKLDWKDPVKYSYAHGGKDGFPYPVDLSTYENSIRVLKDAVSEARIGNLEKERVLKKLSHAVC